MVHHSLPLPPRRPSRSLDSSLDLLCQPQLCVCSSHQRQLLKLPLSRHAHTSWQGCRRWWAWPLGLVFRPAWTCSVREVRPAWTCSVWGGFTGGGTQAWWGLCRWKKLWLEGCYCPQRPGSVGGEGHCNGGPTPCVLLNNDALLVWCPELPLQTFPTV